MREIKGNTKNVNTVLVVNLGGIGDLILSTPALKSLRNAYSQAYLILLTSSQSIGFAKSIGCFNEIFYLTLDRVLPALRDIYKLLRIKKRKIDLAINMRTIVSWQSSIKMRLLFKIINAKVSAGRNTVGRGSFFDVTIDESDEGEKHESEYDRELANKLGAHTAKSGYELMIAKNDYAIIDGFLQSNHIAATDILIGIHPGGMPSRRWPVVYFSRLIVYLHDIYKCCFVITGGSHEKKLLHALREMTGFDLIDAVGNLTVVQLAVLIKRCNAYICNDTGPMHIAAVVGAPLVALCGAGSITRYDPRRISEKAILFHNKWPCAPCNKTKCKSYCLRSILPAEVAYAVTNLLQKQMRDHHTLDILETAGI